MARFSDKVVVITGAASGIGEGAARRFAEEGAMLVLGDIDKRALDKLADELGGTTNACQEAQARGDYREAARG